MNGGSVRTAGGSVGEPPAGGVEAADADVPAGEGAAATSTALDGVTGVPDGAGSGAGDPVAGRAVEDAAGAAAESEAATTRDANSSAPTGVRPAAGADPAVAAEAGSGDPLDRPSGDPDAGSSTAGAQPADRDVESARDVDPDAGVDPDAETADAETADAEAADAEAAEAAGLEGSDLEDGDLGGAVEGAPDPERRFDFADLDLGVASPRRAADRDVGRTVDDLRLRRRLVQVAVLTAISAALVLLAGLVVVAGVGGDLFGALRLPGSASTTGPSPEVPPVGVTSVGTASSPVMWLTAASGARAGGGALAGYEAYLGVTIRLGERPDPDDPALAQVAVEPQLGRLRSALATELATGQSRRGRVLAWTSAEQVRPAQVVVLACSDLRDQRLYTAEGVQAPVTTTVTSTWALLTRSDGRWKVSQVIPSVPARCRR